MKMFCLCLLLCVMEYGLASAQITPAMWRYAGPDGGNILHIAASNDTLYAAAEAGRLFRLVNGISWEEITTLGAFSAASGLSTANGILQAAFATPAFRGDDFGGAVYFVTSRNAGATWSRALTAWNPPFPSPAVLGIASVGQSIMVAGFQGITQITTGSFSVTSRTILLPSTTLTCIAARGGLVLAGTRDSLLHCSSDSGRSWQRASLDFAPRSLAFANDSVVVAVSTNAVLRSQDGGFTWRKTGAFPLNTSIQGIAIASAWLYAATPLGVFRSQNFGQDWQPFNNNGLSTLTITGIVANDSAVFVNIPSIGGFHRFQNDQFTPFTLPDNRAPSFMSVTETNFWASTDSVLWRSANGQNWVNAGLLPNGNASFHAITSQNQEREVYLSVSGRIFRSNNLGGSWILLGTLPLLRYTSISVVNDTLWAADCNSLYRSIDKGSSWTGNRLGSRPGGCIFHLLAYDKIVYASGLYYGLDFFDVPYSWMMPISRINFENAATGNFVYEGSAFHMASRRGELLRANRSARVPIEYLPTNGAWRNFPLLPVSTATITALGTNTKNVFAGTNSGLFVLNAVTTEVRELELPLVTMPTHRAFPSPVSERVTIECSFPEQTTLRLTVHDALGRVVATLAEGRFGAGEHRFVWNAEQSAQGVYWYTLATSTNVQAGKIIIVR